MATTDVLGLSCIVLGEANKLFVGFTDLYMERNFAPGKIIPRASLILYLDEVIWDFWTDNIQRDFELWFDAVIGWEFGGHWDGVNVFWCGMDVNLWGPEGRL